jgi:hypothetical protein
MARNESFARASSPVHAQTQLWRRMRIMIVTDAWLPQTNGVVNTLRQTALWLGRFGRRSARDAAGLSGQCHAHYPDSVAVFPYRQMSASIGNTGPTLCISPRKALSASRRAATA